MKSWVPRKMDPDNQYSIDKIDSKFKLN